MSYKQYEILEVLEAENKLRIKDYVTKEEFIVHQEDAIKAKKYSQGKLIEEYFKQFPKAPTAQVLEATGLSNPIYVNKIRKLLNIK